MHSRRTSGSTSGSQGPEVFAENSDLLFADTEAPTEQPAPLPFVERRRARPITQSWPEALDSLHRLLVGYESANKQLAQAERKYRTIFENAPLGIFQTDLNGRPLELNDAMAEILGYSSSEQVLAGKNRRGVTRYLDPRTWKKAVSGKWKKTTPEVETRKVRRFDLQVSNQDGKTKWVRFNIREIYEDGRLSRYEGTGEDISEHKQTEARTERLAYYDLLTGLPNRTLFHERLTKLLLKAARENGNAALLLLELDRFKTINDSLGDRFGDRLLQEIAGRIIEAAGENSLVARIGGAEFAAVLEDFGDSAKLAFIANDLIAKLSEEYSFLGHSLSVFCNLGISIFPKDGKDCETLMKSADIAACCSREDGLNSFRIFTDAMNDKVQESLRTEHGLQTALARNELFLVYQPQVDIRSGEVTGLEALLRWRHPERGVITPDRFIDVAEGSGLIVPIGDWVLRTACAQAKKWQDEGLPPVPIAVNVSAVQFRQQGFGELIRDVLKETGLDPRYLELELTESLLLKNADVMSSTLQALKDMGVMLAIDDFGTGYSSLAYLRQFKVNRLKIARTFIQDVSDDTDDAAITTAIINMARALNLAVLAEGVENKEQLSFLQAQHCYTIQGFYFSRPVAVDQIDQQLRAGFGHLAPAAAF